MSASPPALLTLARERWQEAARVCGVNARQIPLPITNSHLEPNATPCLRLHFAGTEVLRAYEASFGHLWQSDVKQATAIWDLFLWEAAGSQVPLPPCPEDAAFLKAHGEIPNLPTGQRGAFQGLSGVLSTFDGPAREGYIGIRDATELPNFELAAPLRLLLGWVAEQTGFALIHAAAVGNTKGAALLLGRGGSGKSTTSLACALHGMEFFGDDYVGVQVTPDNGSTVFNLFGSAKVSDSTFRLLPALKPMVHRAPTSADGGKYLLFAHSLGFQVPTAARPLSALFLPQVSGEAETRIEPARASLALRALAPSTMFQAASPSPEVLAYLSALVRNVPAFHLYLGTDGKVPELISRKLAEVSG